MPQTLPRKRRREVLQEEDSDAEFEDDQEEDLEVSKLSWALGAGDPQSGA